VPSRAPAASRDWSALPETYGSARRPLRAAVEDGWPAPFEGHASTAVVAQSGALFRVDLADGAILEWRGEAFRGDDGTCHAVRLGAGFGFVCAAETGGTSLYVFDPPFGVREVARFASPRRVVPSGNGAAVIYGSCDRAAKRGNSDVLCFWWPSGTEREVRAPAAIRHGARPVALSDGRAAFVAPGGESGGIAVLLGRGDGWISIPVATAERDARLRRAQWLDGIEERDLGVLSGWLLFDTELRGARVHLDGKIEVGVGVADVERASVAGRYAVDWGLSGRGAETVDGGMTWTPIDLPPSDLSQPARPVTSCGPAGSAHNGWIRVGWGAGRTPDLALAAAPKASRIALAPARGVSLRCELTGQLTGPGAPPVRPNEGAWQPSAALPAVSPPFPLTLTQPLPKSPPSGPLVLRLARPSILAGAPSGLPPSSWSPFRGSPPPALQSGEEGIEAGTDPQVTMQARIYAWGPRGAEWSRLSQVQARFDDRFDLYGTHITRATGGFWADEDRAADALGLLPAHTVNWAALLDPSGVAALLFAQTGAGRADLYAAAQGEPLVPWRNAEGGSLPVPSSAVRLGPTWFFLATSMSSGAWVLSVYRVDGGVARRLARLPRVPAPPSEAGPKLMRRAGGDGLGLLVQGAPGFEQTIRDWYVLPLDPTTGDLGEPIRLVGSDLEGRVPERCAADADVWWVNTELTLSPAVQVVGPPLASLSAIEMRLGLGPGTACVVAMAARGERLSSASTPPPDAESLAGLPIPMTATDSATGRRWLLRCGAP
jgi:hypothetical protein